MKAREGQVRLRLTATGGQHRELPRPGLVHDGGLQGALANTRLSHQADSAAPHIDTVQATAETTKLLVPAQQQSTARHGYSMMDNPRAGTRQARNSDQNGRIKTRFAACGAVGICDPAVCKPRSRQHPARHRHVTLEPACGLA